MMIAILLTAVVVVLTAFTHGLLGKITFDVSIGRGWRSVRDQRPVMIRFPLDLATGLLALALSLVWPIAIVGIGAGVYFLATVSAIFGKYVRIARVRHRTFGSSI